MKCERCGYQMEEETGVLICTTTDFRIQDSNGNLKFVISTHNLESDDEEKVFNFAKRGLASLEGAMLRKRTGL